MIDTKDYRNALEGRGPMASQWADKPHRLVFDLCAEVERLTDLIAKVAWHNAQSTQDALAIREIGLEEMRRRTREQPPHTQDPAA